MILLQTESSAASEKQPPEEPKEEKQAEPQAEKQAEKATEPDSEPQSDKSPPKGFGNFFDPDKKGWLLFTPSIYIARSCLDLTAVGFCRFATRKEKSATV